MVASLNIWCKTNVKQCKITLGMQFFLVVNYQLLFLINIGRFYLFTWQHFFNKLFINFYFDWWRFRPVDQPLCSIGCTMVVPTTGTISLPMNSLSPILKLGPRTNSTFSPSAHISLGTWVVDKTFQIK